MVEQMLKYVPTAEEISSLEQIKDQVHMFASADRFLYEMSLIPHYAQRLKALFFIRKVRDDLNES